jgi:hypothetical protein
VFMQTISLNARIEEGQLSAIGQGRAEGRHTGQQGNNRIVAYVCWCNADQHGTRPRTRKTSLRPSSPLFAYVF